MKIGRKGNSIYVSIPKMIAESLHLKKGDEVLMEKSGEYAIFRKEETLTWEHVLASLPDNYAEQNEKHGWSETDISEAWS